MSHKTLISGTAYEISGGKTLVNGTAYSIDKGKTLVGGTAYEVGFAPSTATITIIGNMQEANRNLTTITIDGQTYYGDCRTVELTVPIGTLVYCSATPNTWQAGNIYKGTSYIMSTVLAESAKGGTTPATYTYEVVGNTKFTMEIVSFTANYVLITEQ